MKRMAVLFTGVILANVWMAEARQVSLTVLYTTDLHGHILPVNADHGGSLLKCATAIQEVRAREKNVLLVDCGDAIQGSAESWLTGGQTVVRAMEWLKYDAWTLGNHDFDWGIRKLAALHDDTTLTLLGANIGVPPDANNRLHKVKPFIIKEVDGLKIALVGLTTPAVPLWLRYAQLDAIQFEDSVAALGRIMPEVREQRPDITVLIVHQGFDPAGDDAANQLWRIAKCFPEFDLILGGHLHQVIDGARIGDSLFSEAGYHGGWLGRANMVFDTVQRKLVEMKTEVVPVGQEAPCNELYNLLKEDLEKASAYLGEKVGSTATALTSEHKLPGQSPVQQLISKAIAAATRADIVLHGILSSAVVHAGAITRGDVWDMIPYENKIGVLQLTFQELKDVLEENANLAGSTHFMGVYGVAYDYCPNAEAGSRIQNIRLANGTKPHGKQRFRVAVNSYAMASGGGRFRALARLAESPNTRMEITKVDTRTAVADYIVRKSPLEIHADPQAVVVLKECK